MKTFQSILLCSILLLIISCSGSDAYRGNWKATDEDGNKLDFNFEPKNFYVTDSAHKVVKFKYSQNSVKIENGIKTYGLELSDGRHYFIKFPIVRETNKAVIYHEDGSVAYTICRTEYIRYDDLYKLTQ
jgi:hypothetical protein